MYIYIYMRVCVCICFVIECMCLYIHVLCFKIYLYIYIYILCVCVLCYVFCQCGGEIEADGTSIRSWKGVVCIKKQIRNTMVLIHTGGVDAMWRLPKSADQSQQPSEPKADAKHQGLAMAVDELQSKKPFGDHPGRSLQKRMATWKEENTARVWQSKFPVNAGVDQKNRWKFPGNFSHFFWNRSIVSLWWKQHFFKNAHNRWRGFPPTGLFMYSFLIMY